MKTAGARGKGQGASECRRWCASAFLLPLAPRPLPLLVRYLLLSAFLCGYLFLISGCADDNKQPTTRLLTMQEKQDVMLRDPMGYKPTTDKYDISGGKINRFDKSAFKKDMDNVLNP